MPYITNHKKELLIYLIISYCFSIFLRLLPLFFDSIDKFYITNIDGYYFGYYFKELVLGHISFDGLPNNANFSIVLYIIYQIFLNIDYDNYLFFVNIFFSALVIFPIILIAKELKILKIGFIASLMATSWAYFSRTSLGRLDTDFIAVLFPLLIVWSYIYITNQKKNIYLILPFILISLYVWLYPSGYYLSIGLFFILLPFLLYTRNILYFHIFLVSFIALLKVQFVLKFVLVLFYILFLVKYIKLKYLKYYIFIAILSVICVFIIKYDVIINILSNYNFLHETISSKFAFANSRDYLNETKIVDFDHTIEYIGKNIYFFAISLIGYIYFGIKHNRILLTLPMLILGCLSFIGGSRYSMYAWIILCFGFAFLMYEFLLRITKNENKAFLISLLLVFSIFILDLPLYKKFLNHNENSNNIAFREIKNDFNKNDTFITLSKYGYMIQYYLDTKTVLDGGSHSSNMWYPVANIMLETNQTHAYLLSRLLTKYLHNGYYNIANISKQYGFSNPEDLLKNIDNIDFDTKSVGNTYLHLSIDMFGFLKIFNTYGKIDLITGKIPIPPRYMVKDDWIYLKFGLAFDNGYMLSNSLEYILSPDKSKIFVSSYTEVSSSNHKNNITTRLINLQGSMSVIYMKDIHKIIILDNKLYNSFFVQMYLGNYDKELFKMIYTSSKVKIYKLKN